MVNSSGLSTVTQGKDKQRLLNQSIALAVQTEMQHSVTADTRDQECFRIVPH